MRYCGDCTWMTTNQFLASCTKEHITVDCCGSLKNRVYRLKPNTPKMRTNYKTWYQYAEACPDYHLEVYE